MTEYLILDTEQQAVTRSAEAWEQRLGRKKHLVDITEFLWGWNTGKDGRSALIIDKPEDVTIYVKQEEMTKVEAELDVVNWEKKPPVIAKTDGGAVLMTDGETEMGMEEDGAV